MRYTTTDDEPQVKSAMVYLPADYDEQRETRYNVLYLLHASSGKPKNYLDPEKATDFQCLLDHMIENGEFDPLIVVAATYYSSDGFVQFLPLAEQVKIAADFPRELAEDVVPAVESRYRTYALSTDAQGICVSRNHRASPAFLWAAQPRGMSFYSAWRHSAGSCRSAKPHGTTARAAFPAYRTATFPRRPSMTRFLNRVIPSGISACMSQRARTTKLLISRPDR